MKNIYGINPVNELIKSGAKIAEIHILDAKKNKLIELINQAKIKNIPVKFSNKDFFSNHIPDKTHQGVLAFVNSNVNPVLSENELIENNKQLLTYLALDGITDPHNLGAIIRSADVFGVDAIILPKDRSAEVNETVFKTSSGAAAYIPTCKVTNLTRTLKKLKEKNFWIYALDIENGVKLRKEKFPPKRVIVLGSEGKGLKRLVKENCDITLTIPMSGHVDSLNASNACAIVLYELYSRE